jgi:hypothetical protein
VDTTSRATTGRPVTTRVQRPAVVRGLSTALRWLRHNPSLAFEFLTAALGVAAFVASVFVTIPQATMVAVTVALLAFLSVSALLQRVTTLEKVDRHVASVHDFIRSGGLVRAVESGARDALDSVKSLHEAGIELVYEDLRAIDLRNNLASAERSIRILSNWVGVLPEIGEMLARKAKDGCSVQVLLLQHTASYAQLRSIELGLPADEVSRQIEGDLRRFNSIISASGTTGTRCPLKVRAFDARPPICMFAYDDIRLIGMFWPELDAMNGPFIQIRGERASDLLPPLVAMADKQFEYLWGSPATRFVRLLNGEPHYVIEEDLAWRQCKALEAFITDVRAADAANPPRSQALDDLRRHHPDIVSIVVAAGHEAIDIGSMDHFDAVARWLDRERHVGAVEALSLEALNRGHADPLRRYLAILENADRILDAEPVLWRFAEKGDRVARSWLVKVLESTERGKDAEERLLDWAMRGDINSRHEIVQRMLRSNRGATAEKMLRDIADTDKLAQERLIDLLRGSGRGGEADVLRDEWQQRRRARRERFPHEE